MAISTSLTFHSVANIQITKRLAHPSPRNNAPNEKFMCCDVILTSADGNMFTIGVFSEYSDEPTLPLTISD